MSFDVATLGRKHYVSQRDFRIVFHSGTIKRAREEQVAIDTPYGALIDSMQIKDKKGKDRNFPTLNLKASIWYVVKNLHVIFFQQEVPGTPTHGREGLEGMSIL